MMEAVRVAGWSLAQVGVCMESLTPAETKTAMEMNAGLFSRLHRSKSEAPAGRLYKSSWRQILLALGIIWYDWVLILIQVQVTRVANGHAAEAGSRR